MDMGHFFILIVILGVLFSGSYLILSLGSEEQKYDDFFYSFEGQNVSGLQFYPNMRYRGEKINYSISDSCDSSKREDAVEAFSIIDMSSSISFYEVSDNGEIRILCSDVAPKPEEETHFVAGEGGPSEIINASVYSVILVGKVSLYRSEKCSSPQIAIHEVFHALGFDHSNSPSDVMYPVTDCSQKISNKVFESIDELYSVKSAPDLVIEKSNASQSGRFLSFQISVANFGLKDANSVKLTVYADSEEVNSYDLNVVGIGVRKMIKVQNLKLSSGVKRVSFSVETDENEISKSNNVVEMFVEE